VAELEAAGVDVITSGNHLWDQRDTPTYLQTVSNVLRPANYPARVPGTGIWLRDGVLVINLMGRLFMRALDCPFQTVDRILEQVGGQARLRVVDFHAEATSEKGALAWYLDGRVGLVAGTHTHVPTADTRILPGGTATVTDVGMVGPYDSVIGMERAAAIESFLTSVPGKWKVAESALTQFNSVLVELDPSGRARTIERVDRLVPST
jgi:hypothetical protein